MSASVLPFQPAARPAPAHDARLRDAEDAAIVARADALAAELAPTVAGHDTAGRFPFDHLPLLHRHGALGLTVAAEHGGEGLGLYRTLLWQQQLGRVASSTALCLGWHLMAFGCLAQGRTWREADHARLARDVLDGGEIINILVTERDHGNLLRGARPATLARPSVQQGEPGWVISGHKAFCSSAPALRQMIVYSSLEGEAASAEFLIPRGEGVRVLEVWDSLGMRATASHDIVFDQVWVPGEALRHRYGPGPEAPSSFAIASRAWGLQLPALYLGIAEAARDEALRFAAGYRAASFGGQAVLDAPAVQARLGEIELLLGAARTQLYGLAERWERHASLQDRLHDEVAVTKVIVGRHALQAAALAGEIVGGHALSRHQPIERLLRDVQCQRANPPQADAVVAGLARDATRQWRARHPEADAAPASPRPAAPDPLQTPRPAALSPALP